MTVLDARDTPPASQRPDTAEAQDWRHICGCRSHRPWTVGRAVV